MKLRRCPIFFCVFLFCPAYAAAANTIGAPPCEAKEPSEWQAKIDREPAEREPAEREQIAPAARAPLAVPAPLARLAGDALYKQAYEDVYGILSADNECSRFYGGAAAAAYVFNQLAAQFKPARIGGSRMAGRMSGETTNVTHAPSGLSFRLFEKAVLNTAGAFYSRQAGLSGPNVPHVGGFAPDTRGARALILLHELGHVVKGKDGGWLLADDGKEPSTSERNTEVVEEHCGAQLKALGAPPARPAEIAARPARARAAGDAPGR
jgi:hypothetical protein